MKTKWGEQVTAANCWQEYPRPTLVRDRWQNLNGLWQYAICDLKAAMPEDHEWQGDILVPFAVESVLSGVERRVSESEQLWYRREFELDDAWQGQRVLLHLDAVDFQCSVWLNGAWVNAHKGGSDRISLDLTDFLQPGVNVLVIAVRDPTSRGEQPRGKQLINPQSIWYTPVTGIWQTVWLEPIPFDTAIAELHLTPDVAAETLGVVVMLTRPTTRLDLGVRITLSHQGVVVASTVGRPDRLISLPVSNVQLWSPDNPALYDLLVELVPVAAPDLPEKFRSRGASEEALYRDAAVTGEPIDQAMSYTGFREIMLGTVDGSDQPVILLNGEPIFHLGTLDQGWWPDGLLTPPADAAMVYELEFLKAAGFNCVRKHIKVEPERYYYHCDRIGLLVMQDMPSAAAPAQFVGYRDEGVNHLKHATSEQFEVELRRLVSRFCHHPSIVMWVIHNEGWGQYDSARLTDMVRGLDPHRIINSVSGWLDQHCGDVNDWHDYAEVPRLPQTDPGRALLLGEYGGIGWPIDEHLWDPDMRNWGYQTYASQDEVEAAYSEKTRGVIEMFQQRSVSGAIYTQTSDVEGEVNGLLTYDRKVEKLDRAFLKQVHSPLMNPPLKDH
jgi:beta-galactosidase/beta-glucuronidase